MRLNKKTDYCLRVLIYLQVNPGRVKIQKIADCYGISKNHLSVAVNKLSEIKYIFTYQGPKVGLEFNPQAADKTVAELVTQVEVFEIVECFELGGKTCTLNPRCKLKKMLKNATNSFISELEQYKIKDLI
jgi:Rrf2 family nitric oxide-sensitive transcriptional repressor